MSVPVDAQDVSTAIWWVAAMVGFFVVICYALLCKEILFAKD